MRLNLLDQLCMKKKKLCYNPLCAHHLMSVQVQRWGHR